MPSDLEDESDIFPSSTTVGDIDNKAAVIHAAGCSFQNTDVCDCGAHENALGEVASKATTSPVHFAGCSFYDTGGCDCGVVSIT